jgi:hypothetical protein
VEQGWSVSVELGCCLVVVQGLRHCCRVVDLGCSLAGLVRAGGLHQVVALVKALGCWGLVELGWFLVVQGLSGCCWVVDCGCSLVSLVRAGGLHQVAVVVVMGSGCCLVEQSLSRCWMLGCQVVLD